MNVQSHPGTYALLIQAPRDTAVRVGALGGVTIRRGVHVYVGSARGPGGLGARIRRHLARDKPIHWHVDHLTTRLDVDEVWSLASERPLEHAWSDAVASMPGAVVSVPGFGSSDCRCPTHLYLFATRPLANTLELAGVTAGWLGEHQSIDRSEVS